MHIKKIKLYYFIKKFDPNHLSDLNKNIIVIYRNYTNKNKIKTIIKIKKFCKKTNRKFIISNNFKLALKLGLDGVYIPSFNNNLRYNNYKTKKKFLIIGSAHNISEIRTKELQNVKEIFLSPIFKLKNGRYLGINKLKILSKYTSKKIIALGGINKKNIMKLKQTNISGIAGISLFKKKPPVKQGVFNILKILS